MLEIRSLTWFSVFCMMMQRSDVREPGSSDSIVSGYGLDHRAIEVRSLADAKGFFL
jgi:hypothetical protein